MTFRTYHTSILLRILILAGFLTLTVFFALSGKWTYSAIILFACIVSLYELFRFLRKRFEVMDDFFEAVKYRDFSRQYVEDKKTTDIQRLYRGFNTVNEVVRKMNSEKEAQYLYLQKILEMVDIGLLAYEVNSGSVLWVNDSFQDILGFPSFKNVRFIKARNHGVFDLLFENFYEKPATVELKVHEENVKVLLSNSLFDIGEFSYKLVVIHNIEATLNQTESDAWKKLLSVMTHEIMNSIAPISSLANTLKLQVQAFQNDPETVDLEIEDLDAGLRSIEKRSEGLMKFAKTYRSLNKVISLNPEKIPVIELFRNIEHLMKSLINDKKVRLRYKMSQKDLEITADSYLLEQVLINVILNAVEACKGTKEAVVDVIAEEKPDRRTFIRIVDNGTGITPEVMDQIFVPFFTTKETGSGIGLSLCKQIMTLHGGKIQVFQNREAGTTIRLEFPVAR